MSCDMTIETQRNVTFDLDKANCSSGVGNDVAAGRRNGQDQDEHRKIP